MEASVLAALAMVLAMATSAAPPDAHADEPSPAPAVLRLDDVLREARERNPEIRAARARAAAAGAVPARVSAWDDPTLSWEAWDVPDSLRVDEAENNIFRIAQKIPFPGKRGLAGEVAERDAEMAASDARAVELEVVAAVKRAYYDLWRAHENARIYQREKDILDRLARVAERRYATGDVPQADVVRAQRELSHAVIMVRTEALAIEAAAAELDALLSRDSREPLGAPEAPTHPVLSQDVETLVQLALDHRPELRAQESAIAREGAAVALAEKGFYPDFELSVGRFVNYGRSDGFGAMASVTLPFVQRSKYEAGVAEASSRLAAARSDLRRLEDAVRRQIGQLYARARTALLEHDLFFTTHIPHAEQALRVTEAAYEAGSVDLLALLDTARAIEAAHLEHVGAQAEFGKVAADLERAVGGDLPDGSAEPARRTEPDAAASRQGNPDGVR